MNVEKPIVFVPQWMPKNGIDYIKRYCQLNYNPKKNITTKKEFIEGARDADGCVVFVSNFIDAEVLEYCPNIRVISSFGKGYDNIDLEACAAKNVCVTINKSSLTESTADMALGLILSLCRKIVPADAHIRDGNFKGWHPQNFLGKEFHHSVFGIIGLGAIGQAIAIRAKAFHVKGQYFDIVQNKEFEKLYGYTFKSSLEDLLSTSDFIVLATNYNKSSYRLLNKNNIKFVKKGCMIVNISRGSTVDELAIGEALEEGFLGGYASDVFSFEDKFTPKKTDYIPNSLLKSVQNTVFSPHLGTGTVEARKILAQDTAIQLVDALYSGNADGRII